MRLEYIKNRRSDNGFQSTHPVWDATITPRDVHVDDGISIHASRMGCDRSRAPSACRGMNFNPRIPYGMRRSGHLRMRGHQGISIHASRMGCDHVEGACEHVHVISIHASRMGCDRAHHEMGPQLHHFNPRIPYGMRPSYAPQTSRRILISIHASRMGCDVGAAILHGLQRISIHASRMGCDPFVADKMDDELTFQSTHPVWDATYVTQEQYDELVFQSTHPVWDATYHGMHNTATSLFQSTHPVWDATRPSRASCASESISIHASRMGCDPAASPT